MRKVRAVVIIAVLWGAVWFLVGIPVRVISEPLLHADFEPPPPFLQLPTVLMVWGVVTGAAFATFLIAAERRETLHTLGASRVALWGALASLALPVVFVLSGTLGPMSVVGEAVALISACSAILGAVCAGGTLALARRASLDTPSSGARAA